MIKYIIMKLVQPLRYAGSLYAEITVKRYLLYCSRCNFELVSPKQETNYLCYCGKNPDSKEIEYALPYAIDWRKYRNLVFERDNWTCQFCGESSRIWLQVHHIDYDLTNGDEYNLLTLCSSCNTKFNYDREYWRKACLDIVKTKPSLDDKIIQLMRKGWQYSRSKYLLMDN